MKYEEIKEKEGTWIAINQALIDCLKGKITGGDFMDILNDLHPIASDGGLADVCCFRVLKLTISKSPFDVMHTGEKQTEFRKPSKWIESRLFDKNGNPKEYDLVEFINGYGSDKPVFVAKYLGFARSDANYNISYSNGLNVYVEKGDYKIYLGQVIKVANLRTGGS